MIFRFDTWVFNLYLFKNYINTDVGIEVILLPISEEFENERRDTGSYFNQSRVITAKVIISVELSENNIVAAIKKFEENISNYSFLFSFIYRRDIATATTGDFVSYIVDGHQKKEVFRDRISGFFFNISNGNPSMVLGKIVGPIAFTKDISSFLDIIFKKFENLDHEDYLFSWGSVPGDHESRLRDFLKNALYINWAEDAQIIKTNENRSIHVFTEQMSVEIDLHENNKEALLKIVDVRVHNLKVKEENGEINIYFVKPFSKKDVVDAISFYLLSLEKNYIEIQFIQIWTALEALANKLYHTSPLPPRLKFLLTEEEQNDFIKNVKELINELWSKLEPNDNRSGKSRLIDRLTSRYIYELRSKDKIRNMLDFLKISEKENTVSDVLSKANAIRNNIMHHGKATSVDESIDLLKHPEIFFKLQRFLEKAILAILGVNKENEGLYLMNFYNRH